MVIAYPKSSTFTLSALCKCTSLLTKCPHCGQQLLEPVGSYCTNCQRKISESVGGASLSATAVDNSKNDKGPTHSGLRSFLKRLAGVDFQVWVYLIACALYLFGVWEHIPYGGGHIYSDIVTVYQDRFCLNGVCTSALPYVHVFVAYPVVTGVFMYLMGMLGRYIPIYASQDLLTNYYFWTALFLLIPTFLSINELFKIGDILGVKSLRKRILLYFVVTPSFVFMVLTNWYIIGLFFTLFGLRKFLQGSRWISGIFLGISAATNLVTAMPALGMVLAVKDKREAAKFIVGALVAAGVIYLPFYALNPDFISQFLTYQENWYAEGTWMLAFINSYDSIRHVLFLTAFIILSAAIIFKGLKIRSNITKDSAATQQDWANYAVIMASLFSFAWLFNSYVSTPQTNLMLLPFFTLLPMSKYYGEFLAFDTVNSLIDVWGFSQPFLVLGITLSPVMFGSPYHSPIQALEVVRSLWIGKFLIYDGLLSSRFSNIISTVRLKT